MAHGRVNALDSELSTALIDVLDDVERDTDIASVVLTGRGSAFSAGVDLIRMLDEPPSYLDRLLDELTKAMLRLYTFPRPVLAAVNGHAIAGGCILVCACDYRIMVEGDATIGVPELRVGVRPASSIAALTHSQAS